MNAHQRRIARRAFNATEEGRALAAKATRFLDELGPPKYEPPAFPRFRLDAFYPIVIKPRPVVLMGVLGI
jgi:hypothetical protein